MVPEGDSHHEKLLACDEDKAIRARIEDEVFPAVVALQENRGHDPAEVVRIPVENRRCWSSAFRRCVRGTARRRNSNTGNSFLGTV